MKRLFYDILIFFGLRKKPLEHGKGVNIKRCYGNANNAINKIRAATHPKYKDDNRREYHLIQGGQKFDYMWAIRSPFPEHNNAWIGGWYDYNKRQCWVACNPNDFNDYSDAVQEHEVAHDIEARLKLVPPWHNNLWGNLFVEWRNLPGVSSVKDKERGIVVDFIDTGLYMNK